MRTRHVWLTRRGGAALLLGLLAAFAIVGEAWTLDIKGGKGGDGGDAEFKKPDSSSGSFIGNPGRDGEQNSVDETKGGKGGPGLTVVSGQFVPNSGINGANGDPGSPDHPESNGGRGGAGGAISEGLKAGPSDTLLPGGGGGGGAGLEYLLQDSRIDILKIHGGKGGGGGTSIVDTLNSHYALGGNGGGGGNVYVECSSPMEFDYIEIKGGNGGGGGDIKDENGVPITWEKKSSGGAGGNVTFVANTLTAVGKDGANTFEIHSGTGSKGGAASVKITESLATNTLNIYKYQGTVTVDIAELAAIDSDSTTSLTVFDKTKDPTSYADWTGNDMLKIKSLRFQGGDIALNTSEALFNNDDEHFVFVDSTKKQTHSLLPGVAHQKTAYDISGGNATFVVSSAHKNNDVILRANNLLIIDDKTIVAPVFQDIGATAKNLGTTGTLVLVEDVQGNVTPSTEYIRHGSLIYQKDISTKENNLNLGLFIADSGLSNDHNLSYLSRQTIVENGANVTVDIIAKNVEHAREVAGRIGSSHTPYVASESSSTELNPLCSINLVSTIVNVGVASTFGFGESALTTAAFFDGGWGRYHADDSYRSKFLTDNFVYRGDGHVSYLGGGFAAAYVLKNGWGLDAAFRAGRAGSNLDSNLGDFKRSSSPYVEGQVGIFKIFDVSSRATLKPHARYMFFRQFADKATSDKGETVKYDAVDSSRLRAGVRYTYKLNKRASAFADAGWEYQTDGGVSSTVNDDISTPGLRTNSHYGYLKLGGSWRQCPETGKGWSVTAAVSGYFEERKGVAGQVSIGYGF